MAFLISFSQRISNNNKLLNDIKISIKQINQFNLVLYFHSNINKIKKIKFEINKIWKLYYRKVEINENVIKLKTNSSW